MQKKVQLEVVAYFDQNGNPTCACDFKTGEVCEFYRTKHFGQFETCVFSSDNPLQRHPGRDVSKQTQDNLGKLIPGDWCPLHSHQ
jgi:hypothetical protein